MNAYTARARELLGTIKDNAVDLTISHDPDTDAVTITSGDASSTHSHPMRASMQLQEFVHELARHSC